MGYDYQPLIEALLSFQGKHGHGAWKILARGSGVSAESISRTARRITEPMPTTWEKLYEAFPDDMPSPPWHTSAARPSEPRVNDKIAELAWFKPAGRQAITLGEEEADLLGMALAVLRSRVDDGGYALALKQNIQQFARAIKNEPYAAPGEIRNANPAG